MPKDYNLARWLWVFVALWSTSVLPCYGIQSVTLSWLAGEGVQPAGYNIYYGTVSGIYTNKTDVGTNTTFTVTGLTEGITYYFSITSYDSTGESAYSPEISYTPPWTLTLAQSSSNGVPSMHVTFPVTPSCQFTLQTSADLVNWTNLWLTAIETTNGWAAYDETLDPSVQSRFYRLAISAQNP